MRRGPSKSPVQPWAGVCCVLLAIPGSRGADAGPAVCLPGTCPPDETTFDYVQQRTDAAFDPVYADAGASYVREYRIDVSKLEPLVAAPHSPDNRKLARECAGTKIDRVYIGWGPAPPLAASAVFACAAPQPWAILLSGSLAS